MTHSASVLRTSIGKKILMALTGFVLIAFVTGHLLGNLQIFLPPEKINHYAYFLESLGVWLWLIRAFLLLCLVVHVWLAIVLTVENRLARPVRYEARHTIQATRASRVMAITGLIVLAFLLYHLAAFSFRIGHPEWSARSFRLSDGTMVRDVFDMIVAGFSHVTVSVFYIFAIGLLSYHMSHGISSAFQTLGLRNHRWGGALDRIAAIFCWLYFLGNAAIPLSVLTGLVKFHA